jgi:hypothetical protein
LFDDWKRLERAVGRRTAVRYGMIGLLGMAAAACGPGGKKSDEAAGGGGSAGPAGAPPTTLAGHAIEAFVRGTWNLTMTPEPNYDKNFTTLKVADGRWNATAPPYSDDEIGTRIIDESGTYSLAGGSLTITMDDDSDTGMRATGVPDQIAGPAKATLTWAFGKHDTFPLDVTWDGTTLTVRGERNFVLKAVRA